MVGWSLLYVALFMQLAAPLGELHRQELALMHQVIRRSDLADLDLWDARAQEWRAAKPPEQVDQLAPVLLLHFFGSWCEPCKAEFPIWRDIAPKLEAAHRGKLRVVYVALTTSRSDMERFTRENRDKLPPLAPGSAWYSDASERLSTGLRQALLLGSGKLPVPLTLWVDDQRVVRQVLVGSIDRRRMELLESTERLVRLVTRDRAKPDH